MQQLQSGWRFIWGSKGSLSQETRSIEGAAWKEEAVAGDGEGRRVQPAKQHHSNTSYSVWATSLRDCPDNELSQQAQAALCRGGPGIPMHSYQSKVLGQVLTEHANGRTEKSPEDPRQEANPSSPRNCQALSLF